MFSILETDRLRLREITVEGAVFFIENGASNQLLTKVGFKKEGVLASYMYQDGNPHDTYVYSLIKKR